MICSGWAAAPVADSRLAFPCCRLVDEKDAHTGYDLVSIVFFCGIRDSLVRMLCFIYCFVNISIYKSITKEVVCIYSAKKFGCSVYNLCYVLLFLFWELALLLFLVCSLVFFFTLVTILR